MRRQLIGGLLAATLAGSAGMALAASPNPGLNDKNDHGLCTAWEHASANGKGHGQPFLNMPSDVGDYNQDGQTDSSDVDAYCGDLLQGNSQNGHGNGNSNPPGKNK